MRLSLSNPDVGEKKGNVMSRKRDLNARALLQVSPAAKYALRIDTHLNKY